MNTAEQIDVELFKMIKEFQCSGCTCGSSPEDGCFELSVCDKFGARCKKHSAGTFMSYVGRIYLGLPKGFNRAGLNQADSQRVNAIRLHHNSKPEFDHLNVPVWAMEKDGYLFVRTYCPRINMTYIDVIKGGKLSDVPQAIDVSKFVEEID